MKYGGGYVMRASAFVPHAFCGSYYYCCDRWYAVES